MIKFPFINICNTPQTNNKYGERHPHQAQKHHISFERNVDIFEKEDIAQETARDFRKRVILAFSDWYEPVPDEGHKDNIQLKKLLSPYIDAIEHMNQHEAECFARLALGEEQIKEIEEGSLINPDLKHFKDALENKIGKPLNKLIK